MACPKSLKDSSINKYSHIKTTYLYGYTFNCFFTFISSTYFLFFISEDPLCAYLEFVTEICLWIQNKYVEMHVHVRQSIGFGASFSLRGNWLATATGRCLISEKIKVGHEAVWRGWLFSFFKWKVSVIVWKVIQLQHNKGYQGIFWTIPLPWAQVKIYLVSILRYSFKKPTFTPCPENLFNYFIIIPVKMVAFYISFPWVYIEYLLLQFMFVSLNPNSFRHGGYLILFLLAMSLYIFENQLFQPSSSL